MGRRAAVFVIGVTASRQRGGKTRLLITKSTEPNENRSMPEGIEIIVVAKTEHN